MPADNHRRTVTSFLLALDEEELMQGARRANMGMGVHSLCQGPTHLLSKGKEEQLSQHIASSNWYVTVSVFLAALLVSIGTHFTGLLVLGRGCPSRRYYLRAGWVTGN